MASYSATDSDYTRARNALNILDGEPDKRLEKLAALFASYRLQDTRAAGASVSDEVKS